MQKTADRILSKSSLTDARDCRPAGAGHFSEHITTTPRLALGGRCRRLFPTAPTPLPGTRSKSRSPLFREPRSKRDSRAIVAQRSAVARACVSSPRVPRAAPGAAVRPPPVALRSPSRRPATRQRREPRPALWTRPPARRRCGRRAAPAIAAAGRRPRRRRSPLRPRQGRRWRQRGALGEERREPCLLRVVVSAKTSLSSRSVNIAWRSAMIAARSSMSPLPKGDQQSRILSDPANTRTPRSRSALTGGTGADGGQEVRIAT